ncbi:MAG TPA: hypothetical protein VMH04_06055 [Candidatus Solibacter sp.]|nr:hypothetical protein [Candidatus Solibacter sp.]
MLLLLMAASALAQDSVPQDSAAQNPQAGSGTASSPELAPTAPAAPALDLTPDASGNLSQEQMRALTRVVAQNYRDNYKKLRDYTYVDREVARKLDGRGQVKSTEIKTYEIMELYGDPVERLIEKDDKPLSEKEAAREEERIRKLTEKRRDESDEERAHRQAEKEKQRQKGREFVSEIPDAFNFRLMGSATLNGREMWVIAGEPRTDFQPHLKEAEMISKFHGRIWIDKAELQFAKMDIEAIDTVSIGWVLARIHRGTRVVFEQLRVNDEVWLPQHWEANLDMRIALFKKDDERDEGTFRDYKRFRASARIVGVGEAK